MRDPFAMLLSVIIRCAADLIRVKAGAVGLRILESEDAQWMHQDGTRPPHIGRSRLPI